MELKERIIKAIIELRVHGLANGGTIGYHAGWCDDVADRLADTLSLIKELTEENEAWQKSLITQKENADKAYYELACELENLRAENERLKNRITFQVVMPDEKMEEIKAECLERVELDVRKCRADTVRKMQERLIAEFRKDDRMNYYIRKTLDQIAKEMLEGEK